MISEPTNSGQRRPASPDPDPLVVLLIDDDRVDRRAVIRCLEKGEIAASFVEAATADAALERLAGGLEPDVVFLDYYLPDRTGLELLGELRAAGCRAPVIALTGQDDDEIAVALVKAGASDYLSKRSLTPARAQRTLLQARQVFLAEESTRRAQAELEQSHRELERQVNLRKAVLTIVSHDLRSPLNAVHLGAHLLERRAAGDERLLQQVRVIQRSIGQMVRLIEDLLEVGRIEAGTLSLVKGPVAVGALVNDVCESFQAEASVAGVELVAEVDSQLPNVEADGGRLAQVLNNLVSNALRATKDGDQIRISVKADRECLQLTVADTGKGIPEDELPRLFDAFYQIVRESKSGVGLGLAIVRGIVEGHGGRVRVESELGKGTRFDLSLPLEVDAPSSTATIG